MSIKGFEVGGVQAKYDYESLDNIPANLVQDANYVHTDNNYTNADKTKLSGIEAQANKTTIDATLTHSGQAADAKATGDAISALNAQVIASLPHDTASGSIASFPDGAAMPVRDLSVDIEPIQAGSGDPSPDNVRPISGWTEANIYDDPKYAGLIEWNQQFEELTSTDWEVSNVNYGTVAFSNGECTYTVVNVGTSYTYGFRHKIAKKFGVSGHKFLLSVDCKASKSGITIGGDVCNSGFTFNGTVGTSYQNFSTILSSTGNQIAYICTRGGTAVGDTLTFKNIMLIDLTQVFGEGNEPSTVEAFKALFPKDYYAYSEGTETLVSAVNGDTYREYTIDLDGTRYGGTLDVTTGKLTVDRKRISKVLSSASSTAAVGSTITRYGFLVGDEGISTELRADSISDIAPYNADFTGEFTHFLINSNATYIYAYLPNGMDGGTEINVVAPLDTPIEVQLTPTEITTLLGTNNIFADCGDTTVDYYADTTLFVNKKIAAAVAALS